MKNRYRLLLSCIFAVTFTATSAQAQLPPEVQADLLQEKIVSSLQAKDYNSAKSLISEYVGLGVEVPPAILLIDAKLAVSEKAWIQAKSKLETYFIAAGKSHSSYNEALNIYKTVEPNATIEENKLLALEEKKRLEAEVIANKIAKAKEISDQKKQVFLNPFNKLNTLIQGGDFPKYFKMEQYITDADQDQCSFSYRRNFSNTRSGEWKKPQNEKYTINLLSYDGTPKNFKSRGEIFFDGNGNQMSRDAIAVDKMYFISSYKGQEAVALIKKMQEGCR